jgi:hypothetical protein
MPVFSARRKTYRYLVRNAPFASPFERAFVWHIREPLAAVGHASSGGHVVRHSRFRRFRSAAAGVATTVRTIFHSSIDVLPDTPARSSPRARGLLAYTSRATASCATWFVRSWAHSVEVGRGLARPRQQAALLGAGRARRPDPPPRRTVSTWFGWTMIEVRAAIVTGDVPAPSRRRSRSSPRCDHVDCCRASALVARAPGAALRRTCHTLCPTGCAHDVQGPEFADRSIVPVPIAPCGFSQRTCAVFA